MKRINIVLSVFVFVACMLACVSATVPWDRLLFWHESAPDRDAILRAAAQVQAGLLIKYGDIPREDWLPGDQDKWNNAEKILEGRDQ